MTSLDIAHQRLYSQHIAGTPFEKPAEVVKWLGAVQSQDYLGAKWAVGQRTQASTDAAMDRAFDEGAILRTHVLRPTWHFVTPDDIRWLLKLTAPRVIAFSAYWYRKLELDEAVFARTNAAMAKALQNGTQLTRAELLALLQQASIVTADLFRFTYIMMRAELDAVVCSGGMRGKQHTYTLLDERVPQAKPFEREEALAELAKRYFTSRGPATLKDYIWWSGLTAADARTGLEMVKSLLISEVADGQTYWFAASTSPVPNPALTAYLLPNYDEYVVGYTDRSAIFDDTHLPNLDSRANPLFNNTLIISGKIAGTWKRTLKKGMVVVEAKPFAPLNEAGTLALAAALTRYSRFMDSPVTLL